MLILLVICIIGLFTASALEAFRSLHVNNQIYYQLIPLDKSIVSYNLIGIKPGYSYEARVSHPASIPAKISLSISGAQYFSNSYKSRRRRSLLDCDKLVFTVEKDGTIQGHQQPVLLISAEKGSVHRDGPSGGLQQLVYNIVVQELWIGIPTDTFPVIAAAVVLVLVILLILPTWVEVVVPRLAKSLSSANTGRATDTTNDPHCADQNPSLPSTGVVNRTPQRLESTERLKSF
ncbi:hypothetical protein CEUSTIGMA_g7278.t1 [Chlamydomonas eustigma]|uniref:Uncharacterized protein n=1 Tax=Chlamydomonas eustigma TaxID=1157962 RepID=A0A250X9T3_9CHLO|nr:hypothetical protein CEUSTIGMA_g7278.t1 [Chlamydomonas eustigma]|eukprot:GAX79838.1 hypothetical protein CEUSTIGMA_g7278.t1 [Chlamydomonas eustigma]